MTRLPIYLFLFAGLFLQACSKDSNQLPEVKVQKITDHVYALLGPKEFPNKQNRGYMVNSTLILGKEGVILVDTGFTHEIGLHLKRAVKNITDKPITHVINTHHHGDHTLGNTAFAEAEIISAEKCKELVNKTGYEWIGIVESMTGLSFPDTKPVAANTTYKESTRTRLQLQGVDMELWVPNGSHTPGDMMVYLPKQRVLVAGDILVNDIMPNFRDGHVKSWIGTLQEITKTPIETIIPGHGPLMKTTEVAELQKEMQTLYDVVEEGYNAGLMDSQIRKKLDLSYWKNLSHFDEIMGGNINRTYLEVELENF